MRKYLTGSVMVSMLSLIVLFGSLDAVFAADPDGTPTQAEYDAAAAKNKQDLNNLDARNARAAKNGITGAEQDEIDKGNADYKAALKAANQGKTLDQTSGINGSNPSTATTGKAAATAAGYKVETENGVTTAYKLNADGKTYTASPAKVETENGVTTTYIQNPDGTYTAIPGDATAANATATPEDMSTNNVLGLTSSDLGKGNVNQDTIPLVIVSLIETVLAVAGTIAIFSLIYHAVQMQINSGITGDSSGVDKAKKGMIGSVIGFIIAILGWFLVTRAVDLLTAISQ